MEKIFLVCLSFFLSAAAPIRATHPLIVPSLDHEYVLIGLGDSLTQGTMDGADNSLNTRNAYLQKVYESLAAVVDTGFTQPLLKLNGRRMAPFRLPTNLGVDGADIFSMEGVAYFKRAGTSSSEMSRDYLCSMLLPYRSQDLYDATLYPYSLLNGSPVSQIDSAAWLLNYLNLRGTAREIIILWIGNNDSSNAALGFGGNYPVFMPVPFSLLQDRLTPQVEMLLSLALESGDISFEPYTRSSIERNLTEPADFANQYEHLLNLLETRVPSLYDRADVFLCTLPYYSSVGFLFDSEDLEYYLRKLDPQYSLPQSFARASDTGMPVTDYIRGDRVNLITFMCMYGLLSSGADSTTVNGVLETNGVQNDGLVLSEDEQSFIRGRIDSYNAAIMQMAQKRKEAHLVNIGPWLNEFLTGASPLEIEGRRLTRKWIRGGAFTLDGVHPGYTCQALIANQMIESINSARGLKAPVHDLSATMADDPYIDADFDGWAPGPDYDIDGLTGMLFLLRDPDDGDPDVQPELPVDFWRIFSQTILELI